MPLPPEPDRDRRPSSDGRLRDDSAHPSDVPNDSPGNDLVGTVLEGRYQIDAPLARGGMSTVYRGVDLRLDRPVAIKIMSPPYAADPTFLARFEREARAAAKLDNPHVVGVFDQGRDGEHVFLVMELVDGGTLRDLLREDGQLSVRVALAVLEPILEALSAAHAAGLIHRDVKPENVLISSRGEVKVADFGLVRAVTSTSIATGDVILGTVAYLSPEQVETGASDERSDVYAASLVAYEMLTGHPPFEGENAISVAYQHVHSDVPPVADQAPGVAASIADAIDAASSRDPLDRPSNAAEFLRRVREARTQVGLSLAAVPPQHRAAPALPTAAGTTHERHGSGTTSRTPATSRLQQSSRANVTAKQSKADRIDPSDAPARTRMQRRGPPRQRRRWRRLVITLIVLALLAAAAILGGRWLADRWTSMPPVAHESGTAAVAAVRNADLVPVLATHHHNSVPSGSVISASPSADVRQERGATVSLVISSGRPTVPDVAAGTPVDTASTAIRAAEMNPVIDVDANIYSNTVTEGAVVRTEPAEGEHSTIGSDVLLILSRGPQPEPVPAVTGKLTDDAQNKLLVAGFTIGPVATRFDAEVAPGTVLGTDPPAGKDAPYGSAVSLVLSISRTVPQIGSGSVTDAVAALRDDEFDVTVGDPTFDADVPAGDVVRIEPAPGTRIDPDEPVVTVIGSNAVTVPTVTSMTVLDAEGILDEWGLNNRVRSLFGSDHARVTSQDPAAGSLVQPGSTIRLAAWP